MSSLIGPSSASRPNGPKRLDFGQVRHDLRTKVKILDFLAAGGKQSEAAQLFGVPPGSITTFLKHKDKIRKEFASNESFYANRVKPDLRGDDTNGFSTSMSAGETTITDGFSPSIATGETTVTKSDIFMAQLDTYPD